MTNQRESILRYAAENFGTTPEYLWKSTPDAAVLRHRENGKWYGLLTDIPAEKLGLPSGRTVHILNVSAVRWKPVRCCKRRESSPRTT